MNPTLALFGTPHYSLIVFGKLRQAGYPIVCVVTKPDQLLGRKQVLTPTPVANWARENKYLLLTPASNPEKPWLYDDPDTFSKMLWENKPELLITVDYTQKIPMNLVKQIKYGGLNIHPSLLPSYRGPAPVPWVILNGEKETGVSIVTLSQEFDAGQIVAQEKEPVLPTDTTDILLTRLFQKGAELLVGTLPKYLMSPTTYNVPASSARLDSAERAGGQPATKSSYFPRLTRDSGFEPWGKIKEAIETGIEAERIERKWRALHPWPGLWTLVKINSLEKRLKILKSNLLLTTLRLRSGQAYNLQLLEIQLEGKQPISGEAITQLLNHL